jgi:hypothetical protein
MLMLIDGAVLKEPHRGGLRQPTFPGPRAGAAIRVLLYKAQHCSGSTVHARM